MVESPAEARLAAMKRVGQVLSNKFTLDGLLDVGGMAAVYAATHRNGKKVAVKMLHAQYAANEEVKERFLREGYVANKVDHRGSVQILDDDVTADGAPFLVMELLVGESLDKWMYSAGGRLGSGDVLALVDAAEVGKAKAEILQSFAQIELRKRTVDSIKPLVPQGAFPESKLWEADVALREAHDRHPASGPWPDG